VRYRYTNRPNPLPEAGRGKNSKPLSFKERGMEMRSKLHLTLVKKGCNSI
jgi:hypothetical protein